MLASKVITPVTEILQDTGKVTWTSLQLVEYLNDAQRAVAILRPDASSEVVAIQLAAGVTKQAVGGLRLLDVIRNMGSNGTTPGAAINLVEREIKNALDPNWHTATGETAIDEYVYDERTPEIFYVSPPTHAITQVWVEIARSINPVDCANEAASIGVSDIYAPALQEWILYRAFARDSEQTPNFERASRHFKAFFNILQVKMQIDMAASPKVRAHLK